MSGPVALELTGPNGDQWHFDPDEPAVTTIRGSAVEFCDVAARRVDAARPAWWAKVPTRTRCSDSCARTRCSASARDQRPPFGGLEELDEVQP